MRDFGDKVMGIDENIKCVVETNVQYILKETECVITNMKRNLAQYKQHQTTFYWSRVRMSNNIEGWEVGIEAVDRLSAFAEAMMIYSEGIMKLAEDVLEDVKKLKQIEKQKLEEQYRYICITKEKNDILYFFYQKYAEEQIRYLNYTIVVKEMLNLIRGS